MPNHKLPDDPTMVLAIKVTGQTYEDVYLPFVSGKRGRKLSFKTLEGNVIIVPVDNASGWGWMDRDQFNELYEPAGQSWSKTRFTLCRAV